MHGTMLPSSLTGGGRRRRGGLVILLLATAVLFSVAATAGSASRVVRSATPAPPSSKTLHDESAKLVAAARKVGTLNFYTSADPVTAQKLADAFGKKYGIKVTFTRLTSGPIAARYTAEAQAGTFAADAVMIADPSFFANALSKGWMLPMDPTTVPNVATLAKKFKFYGSVGIGLSRLDGVVVNTNLVQSGDVPKTWKDLLDPKWKGQLLTDDPRTIPVVMGQWKLLDATYGDDYLRGIAAQSVQWVPSLVTGVQSVAAGDRKAAFGANLLHVAPLLASAPNAPVQLTHLQGPDFGFVWNAGVSAKSPNPAAGQLFVNWLLSGQGQLLFNGPGNNSVLPQITIQGSPPLSSKFITLSASVTPDRAAHLLSLLGLGG
jgi:iron(III) transport system substrate-binding protein